MLGLAPFRETRGIRLAQCARRGHRTQVTLVDLQGSATRLDELTDLLRDAGLGLELPVGVAQCERHGAGGCGSAKRLELSPECAALRTPVAHADQATTDSLPRDD